MAGRNKDKDGSLFFAYFFFAGLGVYLQNDILMVITGTIGIIFLIGLMIAVGWKGWLPYALMFVALPLLTMSCTSYFF